MACLGISILWVSPWYIFSDCFLGFVYFLTFILIFVCVIFLSVEHTITINLYQSCYIVLHICYLFYSFFPFFPYSSSSIDARSVMPFKLMYLGKLEYHLWRMYFCVDINGTATLPACVCTSVCSPGLLLFTARCIHPPGTSISPAARSWPSPAMQWLTPQRISSCPE